jgi:predicted unusual protein kinase regulating ubiquinone biosynthesis (AarF/ABC1/UbiB family)
MDENLIEVIADTLIKWDNVYFNYFIEMITYMVNISKSLFFISSIFFIFTSEFIYYLLFKTSYDESISRIARRLVKKNVLYVKMFQAFALNKNMISNNINNEIVKYCDNVPYCDNDIDYLTIYKIIENYDLDYNNLEPINSGMISIVFKLKQKNSENFLILKLKRHNIEYNLNEGIERLKFLVFLISFFPWANTLEIPLIFNKNINILKEQLDFKREISNTIELKEACKINDFIKIPKVYEEVTETYENAILMEYIDGKNISKIEPEDYNIYAKLVLKFGFITGLCKGYFHGDLHPGNILFIKNDETKCLPKYQIGIIDLGILMRINEECRNGIFKITTELFTSKPREISKVFFNILLEPKGVLETLEPEHKENILNIIENIVINIVNKSNNVNQKLMIDFIINFNNYLSKQHLKKYGIKVNDEFIKFQMGFAMAHGVSMELCKTGLMILVNEVLNEIFHLDIMKDLLEDEDEDDDKNKDE